MDLDTDGLGDILSGSYSRNGQPMAGLFQVLWGQADGTFGKASVLNGVDGEPLIIPAGERAITEAISTRPTAVDWDGDGDLDLVVGNFAGTFYLFKGSGEGRFETRPEPIMAGAQPLKVKGAHSDPFVVDWDGDGDLDLLSGTGDGGLQWAENVAAPGEPPVLTSFQILIAPQQRDGPGPFLEEADLTGPGRSTRVWVDDVNGDGKLDVLLGDRVTLVSPTNGVSEEQFNERHARWQEEYRAASTINWTGDEDPDRVREKQQAMRDMQAKLQRLYAERAEFMHEDRTGFVWLYLRK